MLGVIVVAFILVAFIKNRCFPSIRIVPLVFSTRRQPYLECSRICQLFPRHWRKNRIQEVFLVLQALWGQKLPAVRRRGLGECPTEGANAVGKRGSGTLVFCNLIGFCFQFKNQINQALNLMNSNDLCFFSNVLAVAFPDRAGPPGAKAAGPNSRRVRWESFHGPNGEWICLRIKANVSQRSFCGQCGYGSFYTSPTCGFRWVGI